MSIQRHITVIAALAAVALTLSAIPASARPIDLNGNGSFVFAQTAATTSTSVPPILRNVKASQLAKVEQAGQQAGAHAPAKGAQYSNAKINAYQTTATRHITGLARVPTLHAGFDWGDASIGAAAGFMLALLGLGGALVISHRHPGSAATPQP